MEFNLSSYSHHLQKLIPSRFLDYIDSEKIQLSFEEEFKFQEKLMYNKAYAEGFQKNCAVEGLSVEEYSSKTIEFKDITIICSTRFRGRDINLPFVEIEYFSCDVEEFFNQFKEIKAFIFEIYSALKPKWIRIMLREEDRSLYNSFNPKIDLHSYIASLDTIYKTKLELPTNVTIERITEFKASDYEQYCQEYKLFNDQNPNLISVHAEPFGDLEKCCIEGYSFKIFVDNNWAGCAFYKPETEYYLYGYLVWDKLIFQSYRGQNLSALIQNNGFQQYIPQENGFIFGTIHPENYASIQTAKKTGRENFVSSYFFD